MWKRNFLASYFSYISGRNFPSSKNAKNQIWKYALYFRKWNFKKFRIFQERTCKTWKSNKKICSEESSYILLKEKFLVLFRRVLNTAVLFCVSKVSIAIRVFSNQRQKTFPYSEHKCDSYSLMYQLFFRTTNLSLYPLFLSYSFFGYSVLNNAPHRRYLTEFWICFAS